MPTKDHRRKLRLPSSDDDLIIEAATLLGLSVSEFANALVNAESAKVGVLLGCGFCWVRLIESDTGLFDGPEGVGDHFGP
jgi:hypothetical protein